MADKHTHPKKLPIIQPIPPTVPSNPGRAITIGICGRNGVGKSTIADMLVKSKGFEEHSFADKLKRIVSGVSGFSYEFLTNPTNRKDRETIKDSVTGFTARELMQKIGTAFRKHVSKDFWVNQLRATINHLDSKVSKVVISDCRYPNEIDYVLSLPNSYLLVVFNKDDECHVSDKVRAEQHDSVYSFVEYAKQLETNPKTKNKIFVVYNRIGEKQATLDHVSCLCDIFM
jgi:hypothetical protein